MSKSLSISFPIALSSLMFISVGSGFAADLSVAFRGSSADLDRTSIPYLPPVPPDPQQPSSAIATISDSTRTVTDRVRALQSMGEKLDDSTITALCKFLQLHPADFENNLGGLRYLKNEILNILRNQQPLPVHLADAITAVAADHGQDLVTRDYAVQHLAALCRRISDEGAQIPSNVVSLLFELTGEKSTVAGTALIALHHLSACPVGIEGEKVDAVALNFARDSQCSPAVRMTALQVCSQRHVSAILPTAKEIALSSDAMSMRLSAIAVIGALGAPSDAIIIRNIRSDEKLIKDAIANAMKVVQRRSISVY